MSGEKAIVIQPASALAQQPTRALARLSPRQVVPVAGAAQALTWGAGKALGWLLAQRRARAPQVRIEQASPDTAPKAAYWVYRARWSVTITTYTPDQPE